MAGREARRGDLFIMGDVDEIPRPDALRALKQCGFDAQHNCAAMESDLFYYSYSLYSGVWNAGPKVRALPLTAVTQWEDLMENICLRKKKCVFWSTSDHSRPPLHNPHTSRQFYN